MGAETQILVTPERFVRELDEYVAHPETLADPDLVQALKSRGPRFIADLKAFCMMLYLVSVYGQRAKTSFPSRAYAPFLREQGISPGNAEVLASFTISIGTRRARASRMLPEVAAAVRFLAKPDRSEKAIRNKAELLLTALDDYPFLDTAFRNAGLSSAEFRDLLEGALAGREGVWARIAEYARALTPHLSVPRGRKVSVASATHEALLETLDGLVQPRAYTRNPITDKFTDSATRATQNECSTPDFDPRPAWRRFKASKQASRSQLITESP